MNSCRVLSSYTFVVLTNLFGNLFLGYFNTIVTRRVARIWKGGGGYFERVRCVQTTLTRIFIALESVSHGLSENWDEISRKARKFKGFFRPKSGGLQKKKKKVFAEIEAEFLAQIQRFFLPKIRWSSKKKKKKGLRRNWGWFFGPNRKSKRLRGAVFQWGGGGGGGLFSIFHKKSASKPPKWCDFTYFTNQWEGARAPLAPPPGYATGSNGGFLGFITN